VQLELGEETTAFGIGTFPAGASGTIVRDRGAGIGTPPVIHYLLPGSSPAASPAARRNPVPGSAGDDNPNNCSKNPRQLGSARWLPPGVQPGVQEDKKNYLFVLTTILMWDTMGLLKQKRNIK